MHPELPDATADAVVERFPSTSGRITGLICLVTAGIVLVLAIIPLDPGTPLGVALVTAFIALLIWAVALRPAVWVTGRDLVLRNMLSTVRIPLATVESVVATQALVITAAGHRYVSTAIGHSLRQTVRSRRPGHRPEDLPAEKRPVLSVPEFAEERIRFHAREARERQSWQAARGQQADDAVRRTPAWPEIAGMTVFAVAWLVWLLG